MSNKQLSIRLYGKPVGILEQKQSGKKSFQYLDNANQQISISMPVRKEPYDDKECGAFFGGLLPESESARKMIGKKYGISPNNDFALLQAIGHECAGAISCHEIDDPIEQHHATALQGRTMSDEELYQRIIELPKEPLFMGVKDLRLSLAGAQDKAAVCFIDNQIAVPVNCPSTHILKPSSPNFAGLAENEYFIMKLAKRLKLPVADVSIHKVKEISYLLVTRYDREINNNQVKRIHQEDFCQALGIPSSHKYQNEGGPGFQDCFSILMQASQPALDRNHLASAVVFNYLTGNMDAHGKNFSLLYKHNTFIQMAPLYDLVCTRVYADLSDKMAMKIGSKYEADNVLPRHWKQLSDQTQYRYLSIKKLIETQCEQLKTTMLVEKESMKQLGFDHTIIDKTISFINENMDKCLKNFQHYD